MLKPATVVLKGSSPLARGLRFQEHLSDGVAGIIPARAGFTTLVKDSWDQYKDHPRSRGVYMEQQTSLSHLAGSSPLARGLRGVRRARQRYRRIIPARAGFTRPGVGPRGHRADHPRSRGVYSWRARHARRSSGSSPLARGLPVQAVSDRPRSGIIPARAGFTDDDGAPPSRPEDHPRSRGVYDHPPLGQQLGQGSSPLARGLRGWCLSPTRVAGIIPARAGFTLADPWNPNDEPCYQTAFTFSAGLEPAPPSSGSAVVLRRSTMTPSEA